MLHIVAPLKRRALLDEGLDAVIKHCADAAAYLVANVLGVRSLGKRVYVHVGSVFDETAYYAAEPGGGSRVERVEKLAGGDVKPSDLLRLLLSVEAEEPSLIRGVDPRVSAEQLGPVLDNLASVRSPHMVLVSNGESLMPVVDMRELRAGYWRSEYWFSRHLWDTTLAARRSDVEIRAIYERVVFANTVGEATHLLRRGGEGQEALC